MEKGFWTSFKYNFYFDHKKNKKSEKGQFRVKNLFTLWKDGKGSIVNENIGRERGSFGLTLGSAY